MKNVKIKRDVLLGIVNDNKIKHIDAYNEAVDDFKKAVILISNSNLKLAKTGDMDNIKKITPIPSIPESYVSSYDRAIRMLQLSAEDIIELEQGIFNQLVLDEWNWKGNFSLMATTCKSFSGS